MRALLAILVGGMMVWMQAAAGLSPHLIQKLVACSCCQCADSACHTQTTAPAPSPSPVLQTSVAQREKPALTPRLAPVETDLARTSIAPSSTPAQPLPFPPQSQRHRVLLI